MVKGIKTRDLIIAGAVVAGLVLVAVGYFVFIKDNGDDGDGDGNGDPINTRPVADAGVDETIYPGDQVELSGKSSFDPDDDDLFYYWDMDSGVDSNNDGINDNDRDLVGINVSYTYPTPAETITYIVTLTVADGDISGEETLTDTDTVRVVILLNANEGEIPDVTMSCNYQPGVSFPTTFDAHFLVSIDSVTSYEMISNFSYKLEKANGDILLNGSIQDIMVVPANATIRFINGPAIETMGEGDTFSIKEGGEIEEGCFFSLYYKNKEEMEPVIVGEVELTK